MKKIFSAALLAPVFLPVAIHAPCASRTHYHASVQDASEQATDTLCIDLSDIVSDDRHPLRVKQVGRDFNALLGKNMADSILSRYNPDIVRALREKGLYIEGESMGRISYDSIADELLYVPAVYPGLEQFFDTNLQDFLAKHSDMTEKVGEDTEVIFVTRTDEKKHVLGYYKEGKLHVAYYISAGTYHKKTTEGVYWTNYNQERGKRGDVQDSLFFSMKYKAPMSYFVPIAKSETWGGIGNHQGSVNGNGLSHGCIRNPGFWAQYIYRRVRHRKVKYIVTDLYD